MVLNMRAVQAFLMKMHLPSQKQISNTCTRKIKTGRRPPALNDLKRDNVQHGSHQLFLCRGNISPQCMLGFYNLEPFISSRGAFFGQPVVEQRLDGCLFAIVMIWIIRNKTDETAFT